MVNKSNYANIFQSSPGIIYISLTCTSKAYMYKFIFG